MTDHHALLSSIAIVVTAAAAGAPSPASADFYRCTGPDGRTIYTDNRATCPGAKAPRCPWKSRLAMVRLLYIRIWQASAKASVGSR